MLPRFPDQPIDQDVYQGFWVNHSSAGSFRAATITLNQMWGGLVISFITLFINATARSVWKLIRFALHTRYTTSTVQDGVYHQRQAILRNTPLAYDAAIQLLQLGYVWRHRAQRAWARACAALAVTILIAVISVAAGIFSSGLLTGSLNEVLIAGRECGTLPFGQPDEVNAPEVLLNSSLYHTQLSVEDFSYAAQCYSKHRPGSCSKFVTPNLKYRSNTNASCPFASELCKSASGNLVLESDNIESVRHLGLNRGPPFLIRYQTHCAPLNTENYTERVNVSSEAGGHQLFIRYKYGKKYKSKDNYTYVQSVQLDEGRFNHYKESGAGGDYKVSFVLSNDKGTELIPGLMQSHDHVSLVFLDSTEIMYLYRTDDPWFEAKIPAGTSNASLDAGEYGYVSNAPGVLGCATKRLFCNPTVPGADGCINVFANRTFMPESIKTIWPNRWDQLSVYPLIVAQAGLGHGGASEEAYSMKGVPSLLSRNTLMENFQMANLGSKQWQIERENVFRGSLVSLQSMMVEYARGWWFGDPVCEADFPCQQLCYSQRVRSSKFYSFSTWLLFIILCTGSIIMLIATFLEDIFGVIMNHTRLRRNERLTHSVAEWLAGSTLQLQRLAHENLGLGTWKRTDESIPTTKRGDTLGVFDITNLKHARLVKPDAEMSTLYSSGEVATGTSRAQYLRLPSNDRL